MEEDKEKSEVKDEELPTCPECGSTNIMIAGRCTTCLECGASSCAL